MCSEERLTPNCVLPDHKASLKVSDPILCKVLNCKSPFRRELRHRGLY